MSRSVLALASTTLLKLRYSYLFLPGSIALVFSAVALVLSAFQDLVPDAVGGTLFPGGPTAARSVLATIAASLITVAGVTFSITVLSLQLVSQQFTPRALRNFLGDRLNQVVAGVFVGVFLYCLVVLRSIRGNPDDFGAALTVTIAVVLAFVALLLLLVFINHMAQAIQASTIAADVGRRTLERTRELYPGQYGEPMDEDPERLAQEWHSAAAPTLVHPSRAGYIQSVDDIPQTIGGDSFQIQLLVAPGEFVTERHPIAAVWTHGDADACATAVRRAIAVANERDEKQDVGYGIRQLADIAIKALSPSVNDPTTATTCVGYLQDLLEELATRPWPAAVRRFPDKDVVVIMHHDDFSTYAESLVQIGRYATSDARVVDALLRAARRVADAARRAGHPDRADTTVDTGRRIADRALGAGTLDDAERDVVAALRDELDVGVATRG